MFLLALFSSLGTAGEVILTTCEPVSFLVDGRVASIGRDGIARARRVMDGVHTLTVRDGRGRTLAVEKYSMKYEQRLRMAYIDGRLMLVRREPIEREVVKPDPHTHSAPVGVGSVEIIGAPAREYAVSLDGRPMTHVGDGAWLSIKQDPGEHTLVVSSNGRVVISGEVVVEPKVNRQCELIAQRRYSMKCASLRPEVDFIGAAVPSPQIEPLPVAHGPTRRVMDPQLFDTYRKQIGYSSANSGRLELVQATYQGKYFSPEQVLSLSRLFSVNDARADMIQLLAPQILGLDLDGVNKLIRIFSVNSARNQVVKVLAPVTHRVRSAEIAEILGSFSTNDSRLGAVRSLAPYCEDPENSFVISGKFTTNSARTAAVRVLSQGGSALSQTSSSSH